MLAVGGGVMVLWLGLAADWGLGVGDHVCVSVWGWRWVLWGLSFVC